MLLDPVVRKLIKAIPRLKVNQGFLSRSLKMVLKANLSLCYRKVEVKTERQKSFGRIFND